MTKLILASASPRRKQLLAQIGVTPEAILPADIDESVRAKEVPRVYAERMASEKAEAIAQTCTKRHKGALVLGADTVVAVGRRILPKTETEQEARECLALLSGRAHRVLTAIALIDGEGRKTARCSETRVKVKRLSDSEIEAYIKSDEWRGKAGGYGIQGLFSAHVIAIHGSYSGIVGLPLYETACLLKGAGLKVAE
jgi:nucleoside triphosphate pyrophosphatase